MGSRGRRLNMLLAYHPERAQMEAVELTSDGLRGTAFAGVDHNEHFHDIVVDPATSVSPLARNAGVLLAAAALHDEDILITD